MPKVKVKDINICYEVQGNGFPLVMIMGLSANTDWWDPQLLQETSKRLKTVIFDNCGAGRSDKTKVEYTIKTLADHTIGVMDALKIKRAHILGISMGGMIAQEVALNYPDRVEKLVLCSTSCGGTKSVSPSPQVLGLITGNRQGIPPEQVVKATIPLLFTSDFIKKNPELIKEVTRRLLIAPIDPDSFAQQTRAIMKFDTYERLPKVKAQTLVMHGKKDILLPPQNAKIIADRIPGAKIAYFENSAHALFSQEPDKVMNTLFEFLK
ncbi:MAG: alpha/beta hydrolase [Candidatus Atabeyarchaeum deiterrae]